MKTVTQAVGQGQMRLYGRGKRKKERTLSGPLLPRAVPRMRSRGLRGEVFADEVGGLGREVPGRVFRGRLAGERLSQVGANALRVNVELLGEGAGRDDGARCVGHGTPFVTVDAVCINVDVVSHTRRRVSRGQGRYLQTLYNYPHQRINAASPLLPPEGGFPLALGPSRSGASRMLILLPLSQPRMGFV